MAATRVIWLPCLALAGCSILYNPDNLPPPVDAQEIDAMPIDADPSMLMLTGIEPASINEGVGAGHAGVPTAMDVRPALIVLRGSSVVGGAGTTVTAAWQSGSGPTVEVVDFDAFSDGSGGIVALRIPVVPSFDSGSRALIITVDQGGVMASQDLMVMGLPELTITNATVPIPAMASTIDVTGAAHYTGSAPVILHATSDVTIAALLDVDAPAATAMMSPGGPGGCAGGGPASPGNCAPGGGAAGTNAQLIQDGSGGGGGGFGVQAETGHGGEGGAGGMETGSDTLVPLVGGGNHGNGGGGGGPGGLSGLTKGGPGGGGAGVIAIFAGGNVTVNGGVLRAQGAAGSGGAGAAGGGGGGGSGGAIFVRAGGAITSSGAWLSAPGGGATSSSNVDGSAGTVGRIRVDAGKPNTDVAAMATTPAAVRGASFDMAAPLLVKDAATTSVTLTVVGPAGRSFSVLKGNNHVDDGALGVDGTTTVNLALDQGRNLFCTTWAPVGANLGLEEARNCIEIGWVGQSD